MRQRLWQRRWAIDASTLRDCDEVERSDESGLESVVEQLLPVGVEVSGIRCVFDVRGRVSLTHDTVLFKRAFSYLKTCLLIEYAEAHGTCTAMYRYGFHGGLELWNAVTTATLLGSTTECTLHARHGEEGVVPTKVSYCPVSFKATPVVHY